MCPVSVTLDVFTSEGWPVVTIGRTSLKTATLLVRFAARVDDVDRARLPVDRDALKVDVPNGLL